LQKNPLAEGNSDKEKLLNRKNRIYYFGSLFFISGIVLLLLGSAFIIYYQLNYYSAPEQILQTILTMSIGITFILIGINLMIRQKSRGYYIIGLGSILSILGIYLFYNNYLDNWYYPMVSYILILYITGFLTLFGNSFAMVTLWIIERKPEYLGSDEMTQKNYTEEEIQRDIEEATAKSIKAAAAKVQFELTDDFHFSDNLKDIKIRGEETRVKDNINEVKNLQQTLFYGKTDKWGNIGIEKASIQLADALDKQEEKTHKGLGLKGKLFRKYGKD
jgi:hypothetical protein